MESGAKRVRAGARKVRDQTHLSAVRHLNTKVRASYFTYTTELELPELVKRTFIRVYSYSSAQRQTKTRLGESSPLGGP